MDLAFRILSIGYRQPDPHQPGMICHFADLSRAFALFQQGDKMRAANIWQVGEVYPAWTMEQGQASFANAHKVDRGWWPHAVL